ncbi:unnamed protein product [Cuscuta epithymum]|uniref:Uncharacterized protein n=1 Tax=Cuscuta epithymum TaxID=186058 RepID=A0AAV0DTC1_9ASTE|nr:unnamed protein product [Cuscuta epithymum]
MMNVNSKSNTNLLSNQGPIVKWMCSAGCLVNVFASSVHVMAPLRLADQMMNVNSKSNTSYLHENGKSCLFVRWIERQEMDFLNGSTCVFMKIIVLFKMSIKILVDCELVQGHSSCLVTAKDVHYSHLLNRCHPLSNSILQRRKKVKLVQEAEKTSSYESKRFYKDVHYSHLLNRCHPLSNSILQRRKKVKLVQEAEKTSSYESKRFYKFCLRQVY